MPGVKKAYYTIVFVLLMIVNDFSWNTTTAAAEHPHTPLSKSEHLSFADVFNSAYDNAPELLSAPSRQDQADQYSQLGESLIVGAPSVQGSLIDDQALTSVGLREIEAGLQFSLWRPGERSQAQALGRHYQSMFESWQLSLRWEVAGRIREAISQLMRADAMLELQQQAIDSAEELLRLTQALRANGSVSQLEVMQAESLLLDQRGLLFEAEAAVLDAELDYTMLTDLTIRPAVDYIESQSELNEINTEHPFLRYLQANLQVAQAQVEHVRRQAYGNPLLGIGVRRERADRQTDYTDSLGISLSIPVGKSSTVATQVSAARRQYADLMVARQQAYLRLDRNLKEVSHLIELTSEKIELSQTRFELSQQRAEMARTAFEVGEADLLAAVIALQQAQAAERQLRSQQLDRQQYITEYNQAVGILP